MGQQVTGKPIPDGHGIAWPGLSRAPKHVEDANEMVRLDPPQRAGRDGWTPAEIRVVPSVNPTGFVASAGRFTVGPTQERPGQRMSTAMIDELAPMFAETFRLDEGLVRSELAKVYFYVGGPTSGGMAITIGDHIFVEDEADLRRIMSPAEKRWLTHELTHKMQFIAHSHGSIYSFLSSYMRSLLIGINPERPGGGGGPTIWGALFTGMRLKDHPLRTVGEPSTTVRDRIGFSALPAAVIGSPVALATMGGIKATRRLVPGFLGRGSATGAATSIVAAPLIAGSLIGAFGSSYGTGATLAGGALAGSAIATLALKRGGAFGSGGLMSLPSLVTAGTAVALAAGLGMAGAGMSSNTIHGWSKQDEMVHTRYGKKKDKRDLGDAIHDAHWAEIDAESVAQQYIQNPERKWDASKYDGVRPTTAAAWKSRMDWTLWNPLIVGVPLAAGAGAAVLGSRTLHAMFQNGLVNGGGPGAAFRAALEQLASRRAGVMNSLGIGAALTLAPLIAGGLGANIADAQGMPKGASTLAGTAAAAVTGGALLTMLTARSSQHSLIRRSPWISAGMAVGAAVGYLAANTAVRAANPQQRNYVVDRLPVRTAG